MLCFLSDGMGDQQLSSPPAAVSPLPLAPRRRFGNSSFWWATVVSASPRCCIILSKDLVSCPAALVAWWWLTHPFPSAELNPTAAKQPSETVGVEFGTKHLTVDSEVDPAGKRTVGLQVWDTAGSGES